MRGPGTLSGKWTFMTEPGITIYTDGAASGNPGPGGYGVVMKYGDHRKELSGGFRLTTNNRMELLAVIVALDQLKYEGSEATIYSDSTYVCEAVNKKWLFDWERKGFKKKKNPDLWKRFLPLYRKHRIKLVWIKGHNNIPENERCDELAVEASRQSGLPADEGYETEDNTLF
jgi:ribonuclease HI